MHHMHKIRDCKCSDAHALRTDTADTNGHTIAGDLFFDAGFRLAGTAGTTAEGRETFTYV
jgi:hypothetical protein